MIGGDGAQIVNFSVARLTRNNRNVGGQGVTNIEIPPTSQRGPEELRAESAEKVLPEVLSGTRLGVPEKVPKKCRKRSRNAKNLGAGRTFSALFRHFFRHSQPGPRKHFG